MRISQNGNISLSHAFSSGFRCRRSDGEDGEGDGGDDVVEDDGDGEEMAIV